MNNEKPPFYDEQLQKRHRKSKRFKIYAISSIFFALAFLAIFLSDMVLKGYKAFVQAQILVEVTYDAETIELPLTSIPKQYSKLVSRSWTRLVPQHVEKDPSLMNKTVKVWALADDEVDQYLKGSYNTLKDAQKEFVDTLKAKNEVKLSFNTIFFATGDSKIPENAGIYSAMIGTLLTMIVCMLFAFPVGVMTAVYLEEFAPENKITQFIEININNLNAVPSILFGLLGLSIYIGFFGMPRSSALVGGLTLGLMSFPVIIVSTRVALRSVPASIRQAAFGLGLTRWQVVKDHVLPLSLPGILTGSIIALARAMGETAPLIIVGMIAFIPDAPSSVFEASTVLPAQIFTWAGMPERAYIERTAAGILVLLSVLLSLNAIAIYLRKKFERRW